MQIVFHPKVRKTLIAMLIIALLTIAFLSLRPWLFPRPQKSEMAIAPDTWAAMDAVTAFYTLDYTASPELWISRMCALATEKGCNVIRSFYAPTVQSLVQNFQVQTGCTVQPVRLVEDSGDVHIWQVSVALDHPWAGLEVLKQDVYVEVAKDHGRWLMNRILFEQETDRFITPKH
jgi:hypothetical protein